MKQTTAYNSAAAGVPFFRSRWGLFTLLTIGSGLYLYQRRGGSLSALFNKVWDMGLSARSKIGEFAPSVSDSAIESAAPTIQ